MPTPLAETPALDPATWVRATTIGWFLGFLAIVALALLGDALIGSTQSIVGIGMGAGLGFWQSRRFRGVLPKPGRWTWASLAGLSAPFVLWDLSPLVGARAWFSLPLCMISGGFVVALLQWRILRSLSDRAVWWIIACGLGWSLPAVALALGDLRPTAGPWGTLLGLAGMFLGGTMLGAVTARPLVWMLRDTPHQSAPAT